MKTDPVRSSSDPNERRIQTYSGLYYNYTNPTPEMILLEDIAHHLSNTCRYSGAGSKFVSVAEHSVKVSRLCPELFKAEGLMHDAAEAYLWDIPKPAKPLYGDVYAKLTEKCDAAIGAKFGIDPELFDAKAIKDADYTMLNYEGNKLLRHWSEPCPKLPEEVELLGFGLSPEAAKALFLKEAVRVGLSEKLPYAPPLQPLGDARAGAS